ncbi:Uncharacterized protein dnm_074130 [Desulfonema magnum]|uniref:Uncharacterized protein n=1 Tax=Desulfonema magnum TaxID=45655 RepID=A0A975GSR7_9BACT|nr:Uncharacterized protein dnm_074130 [Desulfonema magnum]
MDYQENEVSIYRNQVSIYGNKFLNIETFGLSVSGNLSLFPALTIQSVYI